jgi:mannose-6-phosphate isomerase-like protein (cupin superfamily)
MIQGKIWGNTQRLFEHNGVQCDIIRVIKNCACSIHKHEMRSNAFYVIKGRLIIETWKNDYDLVDKTLLYDGMRAGVPAGEKHRFVALENTLALEWYWIDNIRKDIDRDSQGCVLDDNQINDIISGIGNLNRFPQV